MYRTAQQVKWDNQNVMDFQIEKATEQGLQKGLQEARLEALAEKKEIAKNLKARSIDVKTIAEATGISIEEILSL